MFPSPQASKNLSSFVTAPRKEKKEKKERKKLENSKASLRNLHGQVDTGDLLGGGEKSKLR